MSWVELGIAGLSWANQINWWQTYFNEVADVDVDSYFFTSLCLAKPHSTSPDGLA